jgi:hypothetical protein
MFIVTLVINVLLIRMNDLYQPKDLSQTKLLQSIKRKGTTEESMGQKVEILLNLHRAVTIRSQRITSRKSRGKR